MNSHRKIDSEEEDGALWRQLVLSEEDRLRLFPATWAGETPGLEKAIAAVWHGGGPSGGPHQLSPSSVGKLTSILSAVW
jgi:hypothetical protein